MASKPNTRSSPSLEETLLAVEQRLTLRIDNMKIDLQASIESVKSEITSVKSEVENIELRVCAHDTELEKLKDELAQTKNEKQFFEKQFLLKDIHDRKSNLLFYGVIETPEENTERCLRAFMINKLNFSEQRVKDIYFKVVHRLPISEYQKKTKESPIRCIIATFIYMPDRESVFNARKLLKGTGCSVQTDLPPLMKKKRAILGRQSREIQDKTGLWSRVKVLGTDVFIETRDPKIPKSPWSKYE